MRKFCIQLLSTFHFSIFWHILLPIFLFLLLLLLPKFYKKATPLSKKQIIFLALTLFPIPFYFGLLSFFSKNQYQYLKTANKFGPPLTTTSFYILISCFSILTLVFISSICFSFSLYQNQDNNTYFYYNLVINLILFLFVFYIFMVKHILELGWIHSSFDFFYEIRSFQKLKRQEYNQKLEFFLCDQLGVDKTGKFIDPTYTTQFIEQWNLTFKEKINAQTFNQRFRGKPCPLGSEGRGSNIPLIKQQTQTHSS